MRFCPRRTLEISGVSFVRFFHRHSMYFPFPFLYIFSAANVLSRCFLTVFHSLLLRIRENVQTFFPISVAFIRDCYGDCGDDRCCASGIAEIPHIRGRTCSRHFTEFRFYNLHYYFPRDSCSRNFRFYGSCLFCKLHIFTIVKDIKLL